MPCATLEQPQLERIEDKLRVHRKIPGAKVRGRKQGNVYFRVHKDELLLYYDNQHFIYTKTPSMSLSRVVAILPSVGVGGKLKER